MLSKAPSVLVKNAGLRAGSRKDDMQAIVHIPTKGCPYDKAKV